MLIISFSRMSPIVSMYNLQLRCRSSSELKNVVFVNRISSTFANMIEIVLRPKSLNMLE
jgi:hypothetical protein